jgi:transcriptional regulator with XRE-family HTH domain
MGEFHGIGEALKILRQRTGLKQREVGALAGVTPAMISTYETGKAIPLIPTVESLLRAMGFSRFDLLNAIEEANDRPIREFAEVNRGEAETHVLKALGIEGLGEEEEAVFLEAIHAVCRTLQLARRAVRNGSSGS